MSARPVDSHVEPAPVVCVVDADPAVRGAVRATLAPLGAEVREYATAAEFLAALDPERPPACLIADHRLPDLSGLELLATLKRRGAAVPAILVAEESDVAEAVSAMRAGAIDFVEKPFVARALLVQVAPLLGLDVRRP